MPEWKKLVLGYKYNNEEMLHFFLIPMQSKILFQLPKLLGTLCMCIPSQLRCLALWLHDLCPRL